MNDEKLKKVQDELMNEINVEAKIEKGIVESAEYAAMHLISKPKVTIEIDGKPYMIAHKTLTLSNGGKRIFMVVTNLTLYKITPEKYKPYTVNLDVDTRYTLKENYHAAVEAFIRHVTGRIKPEILAE